jgi:hypothetical protein
MPQIFERMAIVFHNTASTTGEPIVVVVESCCSGNVGLDLMDSGGEFAQLRFCR